MKSTDRLRVAAALVLAGLAGTGCGLTHHRDWTFPADGSVILISIDTLRGDMLGSSGYTTYPTSPFLDAFSRDAITFERCIVPETWTLTSHMALLTGLAPHHHRVQEDKPLSTSIPTLAELLAQNGFRTQAFVDGGYLNPKWGFGRGFDDYYGDRIRGFEHLLARAVDWLDDHGDERFFLFLHTYDVHSLGDLPLYDSLPQHAGRFSSRIDSQLNTRDEEEFHARWEEHRESLEDVDKEYVRATYADGIRQADSQLEAFFAYLKETGLYDRSLIVVVSDHGEGLFNHVRWGHGEIYDHTIRVPLILRLPGGAGGPRRIRSVVASMDVMPTILELVGVEHHLALDGRSLVPLLLGRVEDDDAVGFSMNRAEPADTFSVRSAHYHLIWTRSTDQGQLFDLEQDPEERQNLYGTGLAVEESLRARLLAYIAEYDASVGDEDPAEPDDEEVVDDRMRAELEALGYVE